MYPVLVLSEPLVPPLPTSTGHAHMQSSRSYSESGNTLPVSGCSGKSVHTYKCICAYIATYVCSDTIAVWTLERARPPFLHRPRPLLSKQNDLDTLLNVVLHACVCACVCVYVGACMCGCACQWDFQQTVADVDQTMCVCFPIFVTFVAGVYQGPRPQRQSPAIQGKCPDSGMYVHTCMCVHVLCFCVYLCCVTLHSCAIPCRC